MKRFRFEKADGKLRVVLLRTSHVHLLILYVVVVVFAYYALFTEYAAFTAVSPNPSIPGRIVFVISLLVPLLLVPRFRTLARIVLTGQVHTFDRLADCLQRNGNVLCPLSSIGSIRILRWSTWYYLSVVSLDGPRYEIVFWESREDVSKLAKETADYVGVRVDEGAPGILEG